MVAHKQKIKKKHKQHGRIIAAQTSALTKLPLSTKTKFLLFKMSTYIVQLYTCIKTADQLHM